MNPLSNYLLDPWQNHLLAAIDESAWARWKPHLERVELQQGQVICESGNSSAHVYFPVTAIVSLLYMTRDGDSTEIAVVGNEGMVGISLVMGGNAAPNQAVVQSAGQAFRISARIIKDEIELNGPALSVLLRYAHTIIEQVAQIAVCNRHHSIDQQLCRRLLSSLDRLPTNELVMTHEHAASLLGVRREGVTAAALKLQHAGVIRYSRGHITVLDRKRLEQRTCECYSEAKRTYERLMPMPQRLAA